MKKDKERNKVSNCIGQWNISVCVEELEQTRESWLESSLRIRLSRSGMQNFFWLDWKEESLIRMCWEIIVSLRAIWLFHVYIMHMHGLQQSSETRYPISHRVLHLSRFRERYISERWKVRVGIWNKHVVSIWALRRASINYEQSVSFPTQR